MGQRSFRRGLDLCQKEAIARSLTLKVAHRIGKGRLSWSRSKLAQIYAAIDQGYFRDEGIDVEPVSGNNEQELQRELNAGRLQVVAASNRAGHSISDRRSRHCHGHAVGGHFPNSSAARRPDSDTERP